MPEVSFGNIIGGVNYTIPPSELPPYFLADAKNAVPVLNGYGSKRGGSSKMNTTAYGTVITTFHELLVGATSNRFASQGTVIGKYNSSTGAFDSHITGLTTGLYGQWVDYATYAIYANGSNKVQRTDGTTGADLTADLSGIPGGICLAEWGERIWVGGYTGNLAKLTGSALRAPTDFSTTGAAGYFQGNVGNQNQPITGLFPFYDMLMTGKLNQIYILTGAPETNADTFRLIPLQTKDKDSMGFTAKNAIVQVGNDVVFLDGFNIKALSGVQAYGDIESLSIIANIKDYFRDSAGAALDKDYLQNAHFFHYKHKEQIWCSIPTGANTRYWFIIDYSNRELRQALELPKYSFFPMAGLIPICFGGVENGSRVDIYAGCEDGYVRQLDTGQDDTSTAIDTHMVWSFGVPNRTIQPVSIDLSVKYTTACALTPSYAMGLRDWQSIVTSGNYTALDAQSVVDSSWRSQGNVAHKVLSDMMYNTDRAFAFKLRHNTVTQSFEMRNSIFRYRPKYRYAG